jgi:hypothetical protein
MTRTIPSQVPVFSRSEERAILTVTCSAAFLFFNSFGSIGVALPTIQKQFGNSLSEIQWVTLMGVVTISRFYRFALAVRVRYLDNAGFIRSAWRFTPRARG